MLRYNNGYSVYIAYLCPLDGWKKVKFIYGHDLLFASSIYSFYLFVFCPFFFDSKFSV